ncbi:MAG: peptide-N-glycosidase [Ignavibacteriae bacterium]|nr:MAG: peptide-N-glycosidase [Ignavibacteriota bacterium]
MILNRICISALLLLIITAYSFSQNSAAITYKYRFEGKDLDDMPRLLLKYKNNMVKFVSLQDESKKRADETNYLDYNNRKTYQSVLFKDGKRYTTEESFDNYPKPEITDETTEILGFKCRKATVVIRSNHIDIWYTTNAGVKGSPALNIGPELGLVLKIVRNNNFETIAEKIDLTEFDYKDVKLPDDIGEMVDLPTYREKVIENNFITVRIFDKEKINFGDTIVNPTDESSSLTFRFSKGTVIMKKVKLPENIYDHTLFAELTEISNGDAYDRTGSMFMIPIGGKITFLEALKEGLDKIPSYTGNNGKKYQGIISTDNYNTPIELVRFITPFGINKYNEQVTVKGIKWEDSVTYKQDLTDLMPVLQGEVWIGVFIGCYDKGGHIVSLKLKYHPDDLDAQTVNERKFWVQPLFNTVNLMEMSGQEYGTVFENDTLKVTVDIPEGLKNLKLRYISTGHGGWGGGDEFNPKMNEIFVDNNAVYKFIPWRSDCGTFRKFNPASGNFPNGISSSDYSRSGWCPGTTANPVDIPLNNISPGKHVIKVFIPIGKPEGNSTSAWNVSGVLIGERAH